MIIRNGSSGCQKTLKFNMFQQLCISYGLNGTFHNSTLSKSIRSTILDISFEIYLGEGHNKDIIQENYLIVEYCRVQSDSGSRDQTIRLKLKSPETIKALGSSVLTQTLAMFSIYAVKVKVRSWWKWSHFQNA